MTSVVAGEVTKRTSPRTLRGERTRRKLVDAARRVFERDGFLDARLVDITAEAGTALGSFYTYFDNKEAAFAAVLDEVQDEMLHPHVREMTDSDDPVAVIEAANRAYLVAYQANAKLMQLLEQVATIDDSFRELRQRRSNAFVHRNARGIIELQTRGLADPAVDPMLAATALGNMVSRTAYMTFVLGERWDLDDLVGSLTRLWVNALQIPTNNGARTG